jgi:hypothetical protein
LQFIAGDLRVQSNQFTPAHGTGTDAPYRSGCVCRSNLLLQLQPNLSSTASTQPSFYSFNPTFLLQLQPNLPSTASTQPSFYQPSFYSFNPAFLLQRQRLHFTHTEAVGGDDFAIGAAAPGLRYRALEGQLALLQQPPWTGCATLHPVALIRKAASPAVREEVAKQL